jgi:hypothetical protein
LHFHLHPIREMTRRCQGSAVTFLVSSHQVTSALFFCCLSHKTIPTFHHTAYALKQIMMFSPRLAPVRNLASRSVRSFSTCIHNANTSTLVGERAIIDRIAAPGTGKNRQDPMIPIDYMNTSSIQMASNDKFNTSTWIGERALVDRIAAPGTGINRKDPMIPIDYFEHDRQHHTAAANEAHGNTSTWVGDRALVDRIAAPGTGKNRKDPMHPIDYLEAARSNQEAP